MSCCCRPCRMLRKVRSSAGHRFAFFVLYIALFQPVVAHQLDFDSPRRCLLGTLGPVRLVRRLMLLLRIVAIYACEYLDTIPYLTRRRESMGL